MSAIIPLMYGREKIMNDKWIACELHTHTIHSDGQLTLTELAKKAKVFGLRCIALTDHNTISGHSEIQKAQEISGIDIVHGLEWTTFYGHMVAMGITEYVDWRDKGPGDIHKGIEEVHGKGGLVGIAHPYRFGSPMCTGCHWQFDIQDWEDVDYIEVWSEYFPPIDPVNRRAFKLWTDLLNAGYKITAVSGRDWHGDDGGKVAVTYLYNSYSSHDFFDNRVVDALSHHRASVTMGPFLDIKAGMAGSSFMIGDTISIYNDTLSIYIDMDFSVRQGKWALDKRPITITLNSNMGVLYSYSFDKTEQCMKIEAHIATKGVKWVRGELYGSMYDMHTMLAFTNPLFFDLKSN